MYYDALVAKWATLSGTTAEKLAAINALTLAGPNVPVPVLQVMTYLRTNNLWMAIKASATPGAQAAVDYNSDPRVQTLDVSLPIVQGMIADLVTHSLLTQTQANEIIAMGNVGIPWWKMPVASGGGGLKGHVGMNDLIAAGNLT
jgi:hypothetical protein